MTPIYKWKSNFWRRAALILFLLIGVPVGAAVGLVAALLVGFGFILFISLETMGAVLGGVKETWEGPKNG